MPRLKQHINSLPCGRSFNSRLLTAIILLSLLLGLIIARKNLQEPLNTILFAFAIPLLVLGFVVFELAIHGATPFISLISISVASIFALMSSWLTLVGLAAAMMVGFLLNRRHVLVYNLLFSVTLGIMSYVWLTLDRGFDRAIIEVIAGAVVFDTASYIVGVSFGRTKLAPTVSPNKTVEGLVGGVFAFIFFKLTLFNSEGLYSYFLPIVYLSGDLLKSRVKRSLGIKDFSQILGSHGGVLDRLDSHLAGMAFARAFIDINL